MKAIPINPGDILETPGHVSTHLYHVAGVYLGAPAQDSLVELVPLDQSRGHMPESRNAYVPLSMIEAGVCAGIFLLTNT